MQSNIAITTAAAIGGVAVGSAAVGYAAGSDLADNGH